MHSPVQCGFDRAVGERPGTSRAHPAPPTNTIAAAPRRPRPQPESCPWGGLFGTCLWVAPIVAIDGHHRRRRRGHHTIIIGIRPERPSSSVRVRDTQAFPCTNLDATPMEILGWFVSRWSIETTFQESRAYLGVETQRQWSDLAIARTTPALFGMFSFIALLGGGSQNCRLPSPETRRLVSQTRIFIQ